MTNHPTAGKSTASPMATASFERFAGLCAILAGIVGFLYSIAFIVLQSSLLSGLFLMLGGLLSSAALVAVYGRLREADPAFALWAVLLGGVAMLGSAIHGGYDLANAINPPASVPTDLPSQIDPRGLLTFGIMAIALFIIGWLIGRSDQFPRGLGYLAYLLVILEVVLYLGRLTVLTPGNPVIFVPALVAGFVVNPAWYIWLGLVLWRGRRAWA